MILTLWTSKNKIPYITFCGDDEHKTPIFSMEFKTREERENFITQQQNKNKNLIIKGEI